MEVNEEYPGIWRYIMVTVAMVEVLCFSGIIYGWGALVYVLKDEGFLVELCQPENSSQIPPNVTISTECNARDARFNLYFTLISSVGVLLILIVGHTFTKFGTRKTRLIFTTSFSAGCLFVAFADKDSPWLACLGGTVMIGSGYVFTITSTQFNVLFPDHSSTIVGLMNGMKVSSSFMQQLVKIAYDNGIGRRVSYFCLFGLVCCTYLTTMFLYPKDILRDKGKQKNKEINVKSVPKEVKANSNRDEKQMESKGTSAPMDDQAKGNRDEKRNDGVQDRLSERKCNGHLANHSKTVNEISKLSGLVNEGYIGTIVSSSNSITHDCTSNGETNTRFGVANESSETETNIDNIPIDEKQCNKALEHNTCNGNDGVECRKKNKDVQGKFDDTSKPGNTMTSDQGSRTVTSNGIPNQTAVGGGSDKKTKLDNETERSSKADNSNKVLKQYMCGYLYIFNVAWFTVIRFRINYFYGTINPFIEEVTDHDVERVSYYTDILSYSMSLGIVTCVVVGVMYDWQRRFFMGIEDVKKRRVMSSVSPLVTTCIVAVLLSGLVVVRDEIILYPMTIIFTFFRSLLTTVGNTFLVDMFPASIYGTIYGTRFVIGNIFSLIQYALYQWSLAYDGAGLHVNIFVLCLCLTTFIHPLSILVANRREKRETTHL